MRIEDGEDRVPALMERIDELEAENREQRKAIYQLTGALFSTLAGMVATISMKEPEHMLPAGLIVGGVGLIVTQVAARYLSGGERLGAFWQGRR